MKQKAEQARVTWRVDDETLDRVDAALHRLPRGSRTYQGLFDSLVRAWLDGEQPASIAPASESDETAAELMQWFQNPPNALERDIRDLVAKAAGIHPRRIKKP